jgi:hypothetical protein
MKIFQNKQTILKNKIDIKVDINKKTINKNIFLHFINRLKKEDVRYSHELLRSHIQCF